MFLRVRFLIAEVYVKNFNITQKNCPKIILHLVKMFPGD